VIASEVEQLALFFASGIRTPEGIQNSRIHFPTFDPDPEWVVTGTLTAGGRQVNFPAPQGRGQDRDMPIPGEITFTRDGIDYDLATHEKDPA
jgi:uncharacterized protein (DUF1684 family)